MIVKMKRVTLVCLASGRDASLELLRNLGVLHLVPLAEPVDGEAEQTERKLEEILACAARLDEAARGRPRAAAGTMQCSDICSLVLASVERRVLAQESLAEIEEELQMVRPFGEFDPSAAERLAARGINVSLFAADGRRLPPAPPGFVRLVLGRKGKDVFFVLAGKGEPEVEAARVPLPRRRLSAVLEDEAGARARIAAEDAELGHLSAMLPRLREEAASLRDTMAICRARAGMAGSGRLSAIRGYCPEDRLAELRREAGRGGWGLVIEDPHPDEEVPTLIRNPAWVRPIGFMFQLIGVTPGYREADVSAAFLMFYSVFFAMLVGDGGYGLLFLAITGALRLILKKAPRDLFRLLTVLSVCTIAWGAITGSWFGMVRLPPLLERARITWLSDDRNLMGLCFLIGSIHLTVAHVWNAIRTANSTVAIAQLGWIGMTWTMFFMARNLILDYPLPGFTAWIFAGSLTAIVLFMTPLKAIRQAWPDHVMLPLSLVGNFGDVVSYVRLFAVGSAGTAIARSFNEMALGNGIPTVWAGLGAALILFSAHLLNILLSALGVIVHGVRLNTLEFCGHMGIQWTGFKYRPFCREHPGEPA